jgi:opacity protein-like surface antigen
MKRFILVIFILPCLLLTSYSQSFRGGVTAGFTASQVDGDSYAGYDKLGVLGGVFISRNFLPYLDARMEIRYAQRGARNPASKDNTGGYLLALHYIDIPIMASFHIKDYGTADVGLIPGYMFAAHGEDDNGKLPDDYLVDFRKFDLGTLVGVTIRITDKASVSVRYSYSIFTIRDLESAGAYYSWFGKIFGHSRGDFNNYLSLALNYRLK